MFFLPKHKNYMPVELEFGLHQPFTTGTWRPGSIYVYPGNKTSNVRWHFLNEQYLCMRLEQILLNVYNGPK
jgi:hypothetical protein